MSVSASPLRYPGGKTVFLPFLKRIIGDAFDFAEPYAGGAGAGLHLLLSGYIRNLFLNDLDKRIYAFWFSILTENEHFCQKILEVPLTIDEWQKQQKILLEADTQDIFSLGFATFYLNRTNYCGVLSARPIGGIAQTGKYLIDARFNRKNLVKRVSRIERFKERIRIANLPAPDFVRTLDENCFLFLDPPYNGKKLYIELDGQDAEMSELLQKRKNPWIMTHGETKEYQWAGHKTFSMPYSFLANRKQGQENLFFDNVPALCTGF